jgi:hypothetical protein
MNPALLATASRVSINDAVEGRHRRASFMNWGVVEAFAHTAMAALVQVFGRRL